MQLIESVTKNRNSLPTKEGLNSKCVQLREVVIPTMLQNWTNGYNQATVPLIEPLHVCASDSDVVLCE